MRVITGVDGEPGDDDHHRGIHSERCHADRYISAAMTVLDREEHNDANKPIQ